MSLFGSNNNVIFLLPISLPNLNIIYTLQSWQALLREKKNVWCGIVRRTKKRRSSRRNAIIKVRRSAIIAMRSKKKRATRLLDSPVDFHNTQWGQLIAKLSLMNDGRGPCITQREGKLFRRRFHVSWQIYCELVVKSKEFNLFGLKSNDMVDLCNKDICPVTIKLLGVLRMLGRNWICDDIAEATGMVESTVRRAFKSFCDDFVDCFCDQYIYTVQSVTN